MPAWTPEQEAAIRITDRNLLVSAAAGAGKTAVLVERILRLVRDPAAGCDIDGLLIVTFTNAAAAQMRAKIAAALTAELEKEPASRHLKRQLTLLPRAEITTLHSFCLGILRQHFYRLDLDPGFAIADEAEAALLEQEVIEETLESFYEQPDNEPFLHLVECIGGERGDLGVVDLVFRVYRFARSNPWPMRWLFAAVAAFSDASVERVDDYAWCDGLKARLALQVLSAKRDLEAAHEIAALPAGPAVYLKTLEAELEALNGLSEACGRDWQTMYAAFGGFAFGKLPGAKKGDEVDEHLKKAAQELRNRAKKKINDLTANFFAVDPDRQMADLQSAGPLMQALADVIKTFDENLRAKKRDRALLDFSDLEHDCLTILTALDDNGEPAGPSEVALELRHRFSQVLVDEYQDTNSVQEAILLQVARERPEVPNLFVVGDVKQSIYRFRLAEPGLFLTRYRRYGTDERAAERLVHLAKNFRCSAAIVEAVNAVFSAVMTERAGEMAYNEAARLIYGRDDREPGDPGEPVDVLLIDSNAGPDAPNGGETEPGEEGFPNDKDLISDDEEDELDLLASAEIEARLAARRIQEMVDSGFPVVTGSGRNRPVTYRDIVILMRATRVAANVFLEIFKQAGIPVYSELSTGYFGAGEVEAILAVLSIIDNPRQDIPLLTVLRSPMVGLDADTLARIRMGSRSGDFYQAVLAAAAEASEPAAPKLAAFLNQLDAWRTMARQEPITALLWELYEATGYYDYVGGMPGGTQRQANLRLLQSWAARFEQTKYRGLFHFLRFVEGMRERGQDLGLARTLSENEDVVRIMSIHKSKGLEFPVVFVVGLGKMFNLGDVNSRFLLHKTYGFGPQVFDPERGTEYPTLARLALRERLKGETLAEEMRLLYVAMTRARDKLILIGTPDKFSRRVHDWGRAAGESGETLPDSALTAARTYLDWLGPVLMRRPCGNSLRLRAGMPPPGGETGNKDSCYTLTVFSRGEAAALASVESAIPDWTEQVKSAAPLPGAANPEVIRRLNWVYPKAHMVGKRAKLAITEAKQAMDAVFRESEGIIDGALPGVESLPPDGADGARPARNEFFTDRPKFLQQKTGLNAAERGSAVHLAMQHVDLSRAPGMESVRALLARLAEQEMMTAEQAAAVDPAWIVGFFNGATGQRMLAGWPVLREQPFSLALPAAEIYPDLPGTTEETVLLQGVIDCLVLEPDGALLIDYKTNRLGPGRLTELTETYRWQMACYARAVETLLQVKVKEIVLAFLAEGQESRIPWPE